MAKVVKRAFRYRFYLTDTQAAQLSRTFGCVRKVYNLALAARTQAWTERQERVGYHQTSAMLTAWKQTEELAFRGEVSCVPLPQGLRHLQEAYPNYFTTRAGYPTFKSRKRSRRPADYTRSAFRWRDGRLTLAKMTEALDIVWSRPLPAGAIPSTADTMPLDVRTWTCLCGTVHDRDVNAARNILAAGLAVTACGAGVRPQRETSSRTGRLAVKQETPGATQAIPSV